MPVIARPAVTIVLIALSALTGAIAPRPAPAADLVPYDVVDGTIPESLTGRPGDPERGRAIAAGREGNCLACHHMPIPEQPFHGDLGPDLTGIGDRLTEGEIRLRLVDPKRVNEQTIMPSFYTVDGLTRVAGRYRGRPILTAAQIEDLVAYLSRLKEAR